MSRFFVAPFDGDTAIITGQDAHHISRVLRMQIGDSVTLCDGRGTDYACTIVSINDEAVELTVLQRAPSVTEPTVAVTLYQGIPKSEKMEWIIQKCVEIGITRIVPVMMSRCVVKLDAKDGEKKQTRWQKIAAGAAEQSGRGIIPEIAAPITFQQLLHETADIPTVTFYEGGGQPLDTLVNTDTHQLAMIIGPEGGFSLDEIERLTHNGAHIATLGKRILRCETAPLVALTLVMQLTGNMN